VDSPNILKFELIKNEIEENPPDNPPENPLENSEVSIHIVQQVDPKGT